MAKLATELRKRVSARGYDVVLDGPVYKIYDPENGTEVARFPAAPREGSMIRNLFASLDRYEKTGKTTRELRRGF